MEIAELYHNLKAAYTSETLNLISGRIINMFKDHQYDGLRALQKVVKRSRSTISPAPSSGRSSSSTC